MTLILRCANRKAALNLVASTSDRTLAKSYLPALTRPAQLQCRHFIKVISEGHEGWRLTYVTLFLVYHNGGSPVRLGPGLHLSLPRRHKLLVVDLRESSVAIPNLTAYTSNNVPVTVSGLLFYRIVDSYKACFTVNEVVNNVGYIGTSAVRSVLGQFSFDDVIGDRNKLNKRLNEVIGTSIMNWGVECTKFEVQSFNPVNEEVERHLLLQMEAERNRRKQLLDTQASIDIAEGQNYLDTHLSYQVVAKANEAEVAYKTIVRKAEAVSQQVESIAGSLAKDKNNIQAEDRQRALSALIKLKRLEQLSAIAKSRGKSIYFLGSASAEKSVKSGPGIWKFGKAGIVEGALALSKSHTQGSHNNSEDHIPTRPS